MCTKKRLFFLEIVGFSLNRNEYEEIQISIYVARRCRLRLVYIGLLL